MRTTSSTLMKQPKNSWKVKRCSRLHMKQNWMSMNIDSITSSRRSLRAFTSSWMPDRVLSGQMFTNWIYQKKMRSTKVQISKVHNKESWRVSRIISFRQKLSRRNWIALVLRRGYWSKVPTTRPTPWSRGNSRTWNSQMWHVSSRVFSTDYTKPWAQTLWCRVVKWNQKIQLFQSLPWSWRIGSKTYNTRLQGEFSNGCKKTSVLKIRAFKLVNKK